MVASSKVKLASLNSHTWNHVHGIELFTLGVIDPDYRLHCHADVECCSQAEVSQLTTNLARNIRDQLRQQAENIQFTKADILAKFEAELQDAQERFLSYSIWPLLKTAEIVSKTSTAVHNQ